jgi:hypothetical protein
MVGPSSYNQIREFTGGYKGVEDKKNNRDKLEVREHKKAEGS